MLDRILQYRGRECDINTLSFPPLLASPPCLSRSSMPDQKHKNILWTNETLEWFCPECGRASIFVKRDNALAELEQYACELPQRNLVTVPSLLSSRDIFSKYFFRWLFEEEAKLRK